MTIDGARAERGRLIERLETRSVMIYAAVVVVLAFVLSNPIYLAALAVSTWIVIVASGLAGRGRMHMAAGIFAALGVVLLNPLVSRQGSTVLWEGPTLPIIGPFDITAEATLFGFGMGLRLICVVGAFALYATAVDHDAALRVLSRLSYRSALVAALAVRLLPAMTADTRRIMNAQRARGLRLDSGGRLSRVAARKPIIDCLLLTSLERAVQIAESMESRGYGRGRRVSAPLRGWQPRDWLVAVVASTALALGVATVVAGPGSFAYYPALASPWRPIDAALLPAMIGLLIFPALLGWGWSRSHWLRSRI